MEEKGVLPPSQTGFRKGLGTTDNIYVIINYYINYINYLMNRQVNTKTGKMVILFVDMRIAFDSVDSESD